MLSLLETPLLHRHAEGANFIGKAALELLARPRVDKTRAEEVLLKIDLKQG